MIDPVTVVIAKSGIELVMQLLKPITDKLQNEVLRGSEVLYHQIFNSYRDYLKHAFERHSYFTSIVFQNGRKKLEDYYLPLTILQHPNDEETVIKEFPRNLFHTFEKILIVDNAGMGKTTLLKYLFLCCVKEAAGIPIYIELRKLSKDRSLLAFIHEQLSDLAHLEEISRSQVVYKLLESGKFVLFLDGYDEIPESQREAVTEGLQAFIEKAPRNRYLMTSRDEASLNAFAQFQRFKIRPLEKEEAYTLLRNYAEANLADTLIARLEQPENKPVHEFLANPLLTSLLHKSFDHKPTIPLRKHLFYRQVFDALYETHDLSKERGEFQRPKKCGLDIDQFEQILRRLGFLTYGKNKVEFTKDELLTFIHKAKESSSDTKSAPSSILHDLTHAVPLMVKDGNYIRWTHKSIQEYFAAQYICGNTGGKQKEVLLYYLNCDEFSTHINLITLCADIDGTSFKHSIAKTLAEALLSKYDSIYTKVTGIPGDVLEKRKRLVAGRTFFLTCMDLPPNFGLTSRPLLEDYNRYFAPIHATMMHQSEMLGIDTDLGSEIIWAKVGVSEVFNKVSRGAEYLFAGTELPFIDGAFKISSDVEDVLENMGNTLPNPPHVEIINDEAANPLNQAHLFKEITTVIETYAGWRFNPHEARKLLEEIENESKAQEEMMRILSF